LGEEGWVIPRCPAFSATDVNCNLLKSSWKGYGKTFFQEGFPKEVLDLQGEAAALQSIN
jgi:hypothetical protein